MAKKQRKRQTVQQDPDEVYLVGFTIADIEVFTDRDQATNRMKKRLFDLQQSGATDRSVTFRPVKLNRA